MSVQKKVSKFTSNVHEDELGKILTVSGKIRYLHSHGYERSDISRLLNIRYQHVRNVLLQPLKKMNG